MIGVGVQNKGGAALKATIDTDLYHAFTAVTNIVFAYCAHVAFFGLLAEMKNPKDFPKALYMLQTFEIIFYTVAAVVIYYYVGQDVKSPALGSAGPVLKKVAYGIAIPTVRQNPYPCTISPARRILTNPPDHWRRCRQRPRRVEIHLRPSLPWHRPHAPARSGFPGLMGSDRSDLLDHRLDHRRRHSGVQRPAESDQLSLCQLVQLRPQRCVLAAHQPGPVVFVAEKDLHDHRQRLGRLDRWLHVWPRSLRLW